MADVILRDGTAVYLAATKDGELAVPYGALSAYQVRLRGSDEFVGVVAKIETTSYRKVGRLIARTFHPTRWVARLAGFYRDRDGYWREGEYGGLRDYQFAVGFQLYSRRDAIETLVRAFREAREELSV
jgi:hypothetical protein